MSGLLGFQRRSLLQELGFIAAMKPKFSIFCARMREKGKDLRCWHDKNDIKQTRILERDEMHAIYAWLFAVDQEAVIPAKNLDPAEYDEYELELMKAEYSEYVNTYLAGYINNIFKLANRLYTEANTALVEHKELYHKVRIKKKGGTRQATKKVLGDNGVYYGSAVVRHSVIIPTKATRNTVKELLEEITPQIVMLLNSADYWQSLDHLYMRVKPCLSNYGEYGRDFKALQYLRDLYRELNRIKIVKTTRSGNRILGLDGLPNFKQWLADQ